MIPKVLSGVIISLFFTSLIFAQLNEFIITPQPPPAVIPIFTSHPDKAAIIIYSSVDDLKFDSNTEGIVKIMTDEVSGTYTIIVYPERQFIKVKKRGFLEGLINVPPIEQRQVLYYKIEPKTEINNLLPVTIITEPAGADVYIDGEFKGTSTTFELPPGIHKIKAVKQGFGEKEITASVSKENVYFTLRLVKIDPVMITITSDPKQATVFINDTEEGLTDLQRFKMPGTYKIRITKSGYLATEEELIISANQEVIKEYKLAKNTGKLILNLTPADASIKINNEEKKILATTELAPGTYKITAERRGYFPRDELITVERGQTTTVDISLTPKIGSLQLTVSPINAIGELKYEGKRVRNFTGSQLFNDLSEGDYELYVSAIGYMSMKQKFEIKYNETTSLGIQLETGSDSPAGLVHVDGGVLKIGNRYVSITDFYIGKYEVTQELWMSVMMKNPSEFKNGEKLPVEQISWYDAIEFCNKLSEKEGLQKAYSKNGLNVTVNMRADGYRLPTEAEWEFAARGGVFSKGYFYSGGTIADIVSWYDSNSNKKTHPVGLKRSNELGLFDMSGNVWEWCWDWYANYNTAEVKDPVGPETGKKRVIRGGSWVHKSNDLSPFNRASDSPDKTSMSIGMRLVRSVIN